MSPKVTEEYKENRKLEILKIAKKVFSEKGYEPTTMKDVVEQCGLSRGGVYQYFSSTEEMFRGIVELDDKSSEKEFIDMMSSPIPIWESLLNIVNNYRNVPTNNFTAVQFEYTVTGWRDQDRLPYILKRAKYWKNNFILLLQEGVDRGEFKAKQPLQTIVDFLLNVLDGILLHQQLGGHKVMDIDGEVDALIFYLEAILLNKSNEVNGD